MELKDARNLALELMQAHGVGHWNFKFDRATRRFGLCTFTTKTLSLSAPLTELNDEDKIGNVILHEIAHALAGSKAGHGPAWRAVHRSLGGNARRTESGVIPPSRYTAVCPKCKTTHNRQRVATRRLWCACVGRYNLTEELLLVWVDNKRKAA